MRSIRHDLGPAHPARLACRTGNHRNRGGGDHRARPQRVDGDARRAEFLGHPENAHAHPVLGHRVGDMVAEPFRVEVQRRRQRQDVRIAPGACRRVEVRQARLRTEERAADIDVEHQVETLHRRRERAGEADRARVVDEDVDAAEGAPPLRRPRRAPQPRRECRRESVAPCRPLLRSPRPRCESCRAVLDSDPSFSRQLRRWRRRGPRARRLQVRCRAIRR